MAGITQEAAEKILEADFTNIVRKVRDGKTLTSTERARVQARAAGSSATLTEAKTIVELASALGVTRRTLSNWRKMKGAPEPNPNGSHNVSAWRDFVQANELKGHVDGGGAETEALRGARAQGGREEGRIHPPRRRAEGLAYAGRQSHCAAACQVRERAATHPQRAGCPRHPGGEQQSDR